MLLFHGSDHVVDMPQYGLGRPYNDYGQGFYCTESLDMAKEWSAGVGRKSGYVNRYSLNTSGLEVLDLSSKPFCILNWLAVLLENRAFMLDSPQAESAASYVMGTFMPDYKNADVIRGPRGDASYFAFASAFLNGEISYRQLKKAMKLGAAGEQVVLKSFLAFEQIIFAGTEEVPVELWLSRREKRDHKARKRFLTEPGSGPDEGGLYVQDLVQEGIGAGDARL